MKYLLIAVTLTSQQGGNVDVVARCNFYATRGRSNRVRRFDVLNRRDGHGAFGSGDQILEVNIVSRRGQRDITRGDRNGARGVYVIAGCF